MQPNWEKEFGIKYSTPDFINRLSNKEKFHVNLEALEELKQFISRVEQEAIERTKEEMLDHLKSDDMTIDEGIHTDGADITDTPPEMWAEMAGLRKGWEAAKTVMREFLSPERKKEVK